MIKFHCLNIFIAITFIFSVSHGQIMEQTAKIFPLGKTSGDPDFIQKSQIERKENDVILWTSEIRDLTGQLIMTEKAEIKDNEIQLQKIQQLQILEAYELDRKMNNVIFKTFKIENNEQIEKSKSKEIKVDQKFITGPSTTFNIQNKWNDLAAGKTIEVEFGVFELERKVNFSLSKHEENEQTMTVKLKPSNFFIGMLVEPLFMEFDRNTKLIKKFRGRTPLQKKVGKKWKPYDAEIFYTYSEK